MDQKEEEYVEEEFSYMLILTNCNFLGAETWGAIKSDLTPKLERNLDPQPKPNSL